MNVNIPNKVCLVLLLFLGPIILKAQEIVELETYLNQEVEYLITSYPPGIVIQGDNGSNGIASWEQINTTEFKIIYTPNNGFIGKDTFDIISFPFPSIPSQQQFIVTVNSSEVLAHADVVSTPINQAINIDVLLNDLASHGNLNIQNIALVDYGEAIINSNSIDFIPEADFTGIAHVNYIACDGFGTCDLGTVSINVIGAASSQDTLNIFTKKNQSQVVLVPSDFLLTALPTSGQYDVAGNLYTPDEDFVGSDEFELTLGERSVFVRVNVLDYTPPIYAINDKVFTTPYSPVEFNVLENDNSTSCFNLESAPANGSVELSNFPLGTVTYIPNKDFVGVDEFTYSVMAPGCSGEAELATVQVYVSNYEPSASKYIMVTPKRTPLIIGYNIPIPDFSFTIKDQGDFGQAYFLAGAVDTLIYGQLVKGNNIILYVPDEEVTSGQDAFEVEYCTSYAGECQFTASVKVEVHILDLQQSVPDLPFCIDDCVWPGDTNLDGVVNVEDLLPLGLRMGEIGEQRMEADLEVWYGQFATDWETQLQTPKEEIDLKHLDTNGDSFLSADDTIAIQKFYNYTHDITASRIPNFEHKIRLKGDITANPGDVIELEMFMGDAENPAIDIYGFTFPFEYNPDFFDPESVSVDFDRGSWLAYNSPTLKLSHNNNEGLVESAFTRTNNIAVSGHGKIATTRVVITVDVAGFRPDQDEIEVPIGGGVATVTNSAGDSFGALVEETSITIKLKKEVDEDSPITADQLKLYPNPAQNLLNIHLNGMNEFERAIVYNLRGQMILDTGAMKSNHAQLNVQNLDNGMYFVSVYTEQGVLNKKLEIVKY